MDVEVSCERTILLIRGHKVILNRVLASLYGVATRDLNKASAEISSSSRTIHDTAHKVGVQQLEVLIWNIKLGGTRKLPRAFTEQGVAMLSGVLRSKRAVQANIAIMRTFIRLRTMIASNKELAKRLNELERKYDAQFKVVFDAIRELMTPPKESVRRIGFQREGGK